MSELRKYILIALFIIDVFLVWMVWILYPLVWASKEEAPIEMDYTDYNMHYIRLDYGEWVPVYTLKEHLL